MPDPIDVIVGENIRRARFSRGMTQGALAKQIGTKFQQLQKYETAQNRVSASRLVKIAAALELPISYFFVGTQSDCATQPEPFTLRDGLHMKHMHMMDQSNRNAMEILAVSLAKANAE